MSFEKFNEFLAWETLISLSETPPPITILNDIAISFGKFAVILRDNFYEHKDVKEYGEVLRAAQKVYTTVNDFIGDQEIFVLEIVKDYLDAVDEFAVGYSPAVLKRNVLDFIYKGLQTNPSQTLRNWTLLLIEDENKRQKIVDNMEIFLTDPWYENRKKHFFDTLGSVKNILTKEAEEEELLRETDPDLLGMLQQLWDSEQEEEERQRQEERRRQEEAERRQRERRKTTAEKRRNAARILSLPLVF